MAKKNPNTEKKFSKTMTTFVSSNGVDTSYMVPENCITTMAINKTINSTNVIICPPTIPPTATEGVIWIFFPKTSGNCEALNIKCDVWLGFNTTQAVPVINAVKHSSNSSMNNNSAGFSCGTSGSCSSCKKGGSTTKCSFSGVSCQSNQVGVSVNIEFAAGVASVVSKNACPCATVIYLNLDNTLGYHASFDSSDGDPGLDFIFPECTGSSANVVYSATAKAAIDGYRKQFKHPHSTETMHPTDKGNFILQEVAKYAAQNVASCSSRCSEKSCEKSCYRKNKYEESGEEYESQCGGRDGCEGCKECERPRRRRSAKSYEKPCRKPSGCSCQSCRVIL